MCLISTEEGQRLLYWCAGWWGQCVLGCFCGNIQNMKNIIELERKSSEISDDIKDILHAADINFQALIVQAKPLHPALPEEFAYLHSLLHSLQKLLDERPQLHMGYLITRQIQEEEQRVRRERLADYEEKIYDQRRIISDKEGFFESLLRPKKKRLPNQTADEFQQARARERQAEERAKSEQLLKELADIQALKRLIEQQERDSLILQKREKNCSISNVNSTALSLNQQEYATEKILPLPATEEKGKDSPIQHVRTNSLQHSIVREPSHKQGEKESQGNLNEIINELCTFKTQNQELHHIYDQECLALKFKKIQNSKLLAQYQHLTKELANANQKLATVKKEQAWRHQRCSRPIRVPRRANSAQKPTQ